MNLVVLYNRNSTRVSQREQKRILIFKKNLKTHDQIVSETEKNQQKSVS